MNKNQGDLLSYLQVITAPTHPPACQPHSQTQNVMNLSSISRACLISSIRLSTSKAPVHRGKMH